MPRVKVDRAPIVCACGCETTFVPSRSTQRFATGTCRKRADRATKAAEAGAAEASKSGTDAEHQLVKAMRTELEAAGVLDTFKAQLALQLGRKLVDPSEKASTVTSLSKEIDRVMADAIAGKAPAAGETPPAERDEVAELRAERERLARDAAAGA